MTRPNGSKAAGWVLAVLAALLGAWWVARWAGGGKGPAWVPVPGTEGAVKSAAWVRGDRRAYDGAPPVIPHGNFGVGCINCHDAEGVAVEGLGYAPSSPHGEDQQAGALVRCGQCHVFQTTKTLFARSDFAGDKQNLRAGHRLFEGAPPVIPHPVFMREDCLACHSGPAAREEIRTSHPERTRCLQCHLPQSTVGEFIPESEGGRD